MDGGVAALYDGGGDDGDYVCLNDHDLKEFVKSDPSS
jgi:hypothetical protein